MIIHYSRNIIHYIKLAHIATAVNLHFSYFN